MDKAILKQHILDTLRKVSEAVEREDYEAVESLTFFSPAGDGYGNDNNCINFADSDWNGIDILEAMQLLKASQ